MRSEESGNPLAEVGLALSMAFFSLMILMLVAILNTAPTNQQVKMGDNGTSPTTEKMDLFVYNRQHRLYKLYYIQKRRRLLPHLPYR
mgnify:CR=1 FL=1